MNKTSTFIGTGIIGTGLGFCLANYYMCYKKINTYNQFLINIEKTEDFEKYELDVCSYNYYKDKGSMHMKYGEIGKYYVYDNKKEIMYDIPPEFIHRTSK